MIRKTRLGLVLSAIGLVAGGMVLFPNNAQAQELLCPDTGIPMSQDPGCTTPNNGNQQSNESESSAPQAPRPDPLDAKMAIMAETLQGLNITVDIMSQMARLQAGAWRYSSPGERCSATFIAPEGFVRIDGPTRKMKYPLLTFYAKRVAEPNGYKAVDITLENSSPDSGQSATLPAKGLNWSSNDGKGGFLSLQLATTAALIRGLEDNMRFRLSVAGRPVVNINWHGGNEAKAHLAQCLHVRV